MQGFQHRGVMLDLARLTERPEYYHRMLPRLAEWGFNLLHLHFTDDQGCALRFRSHPELATPHAFTVPAMRAFCREARAHGMEVLPELECFGHTGFITRLKRYRGWSEVRLQHNRFSGMCAFLPEARVLLKDLIQETIDVFEPRVLHAGLDEVNFGHHPYSRALLKERSAPACFVEHVQWCHATIGSLGARMGMWGDHMLNDPEETIARGTPKDTLIFDWHYEPEPDPASLDFFVRHGFEVYGAPAVQCWHNRIVSNRWTFQNLLRMADAGRVRRRKGVTGMVATAWCPQRYVAGTLDYPLAFAGAVFSSDDGPSSDFSARFVESFWGLTGRRAERVGAAVHDVYRLAPTHVEYERMMFGRECARANRVFTRADQWIAQERLPPIQDAEKSLSEIRSAKKNTEHLADLLAAVQFLRALYTYAARGRTGQPGWSSVRLAIQATWLRHRYEGPALRDKRFRLGSTRAFAHDSIMWHLNAVQRMAGK